MTNTRAIVLLLWSLSACSGSDGADGAEGDDGDAGKRGAEGADGVDGERGADGANGVRGDDGASGSVVRIDDEPAGDHCAAGGLAVQSGRDDDGDGELGDEEIDATHYVCAGADGAASGGAVTVGNVAGFEAIGAGDHAVLRWDNPVGAAFGGVSIRRTTGGFALSPDEGTGVYDGTGTTVTDTGLTVGTEYAYRAFAYDADGHFASGSDARVTALAPGSRDPSFNGSGAVFIEPQQLYSNALGLVIDAQGRIVLSGYDQGNAGGTGRATAWRLNRDGSLDHTFGQALAAPQSVAGGAALDAMGRVVFSLPGPKLLRLMPDGAIDESFGDSGVADLALGTGYAYLKVDAEGRIVALAVLGSSGIILTRVTDQGELDADFGNAGKVQIDQLPNAASVYVYGNGLAFDGSDILVTGVGGGPGGNFDLALWRFDQNGDPVTSFDGDGLVTVDGFGDNVASGSAVAVDANHAIVVAGYINAGPNVQLALWRFTAAGVLDATFSGDGVVTDADPGGGTGYDSAMDVVLDDQGRIVVGGNAGNAAGGTDFLVERYLPSGELDPDFGDGGRVFELGFDGAGTFGEGATRIGLDPWGRIVVVGYAGPANNGGVQVWRLVP